MKSNNDPPAITTIVAPAGVTPSPVFKAIQDGVAYSVGTDKQAVNALVSAGYFRATIGNPAGSGKRLIVYSIEVNNTAAHYPFADLFYNPTAGLPTTMILTPKNQQYATSNTNNTSVAVVKCDASSGVLSLNTTPMSGGSKQYSVGVPPSARTVYNATQYVLHPGVTLGMSIAYMGGALTASIAAFNFSLIVNYYEEAV